MELYCPGKGVKEQNKSNIQIHIVTSLYMYGKYAMESRVSDPDPEIENNIFISYTDCAQAYVVLLYASSVKNTVYMYSTL